MLDFAATQWNERYGFPKVEAKTYIEENLEAGKILLLLDALDETTVGEDDSQAEINYERVFNAITNIAVRVSILPGENNQGIGKKGGE